MELVLKGIINLQQIGLLIVERFFLKGNIVLFIILGLFVMDSCKVDEFKLNKLGIKEDWNTELVIPLFHGNMEFRDFIYDWYHYIDQFQPNEPMTSLEYKDGYIRVIPTRLIFEPSVVIDSFPLLIQGTYELDSINMEFNVTNASPYPLNLELQFFNKTDSSTTGPMVNPGEFAAGSVVGNTIEPVQTIQYVNFTPEQVKSFSEGNRMKCISWYTQNGYKSDTLSAHYPIEVSIIVWGRVKGKNAE